MDWIKCTDEMPKAGQLVLIYFRNELGKDRRLRAFYAPRYTVETGVDNDWYEYKPDDMEGADDEAYLPEGWYESNEYEDTHWHISGEFEITHWMPLPAPPSSNAALTGERSESELKA